MLECLNLFEQLAEDDYTKESETLRKYYRNAVYIYYRVSPDGVPVGASKSGGCPDLPPEIALPDIPLLVQINLYELAESGADIENLLPKTGMLYIFWNQEIDECKYDVIYWDGDMSTLRRCGNSGKEKYAIEFEVHGGIIYEEYDEKVVYCEGLRDLVADYGYDPDALVASDDKLLGYPFGGNKPDFDKDDVLLFQCFCNVGGIFRTYWIMKKSDLKQSDFSKVRFDYDMIKGEIIC